MSTRPLTLAMLMVALCAACTSGPQRPPGEQTLSDQPLSGELTEPIDFANLDHKRLSDAICEMTNITRAQHGAPRLPTHPTLTAAAQAHTDRMVRANFFDHVDPSASRRTPELRAARAGIANPKIAENIALTVGLQYFSGEPVFPRGKGKFSRSPEGPLIPPHTYESFAAAAMDQWMRSPGHRKNLLSLDAREVGCAASFFWQDGFPALKAAQVFQFFEPVKMR